jgi:ribosomal protein L12E/L44/L45/RPP1/RPP2
LSPGTDLIKCSYKIKQLSNAGPAPAAEKKDAKKDEKKEDKKDAKKETKVEEPKKEEAEEEVGVGGLFDF